MKRWLVLVLLSLVACSLARASVADIYYAQSAQGSNNGADCADAYAYNDGTNGFNTSSKWGSGSTQIGPGTTIHICGTWTGTAGQNFLTFQGSGASGKPVTLLFESGADLKAPYIGTAIDTNGQSHIVINGQNYATATIESTANGHGLTYQQASVGIYANAPNDLTIENLTFKNLCVEVNGDSAACPSGAAAIQQANGNGGMTVENTLCYQVTYCFVGQVAVGDGPLNFLYNTWHDNSNSISFGSPGGSGSFGTVTIQGNDFYCTLGANCSYADTADEPNNRHNEVFHIYAGGPTGTFIVDKNYFHDMGTAEVTGMLNWEDDQVTEIVTNNVFAMSYPAGSYGSSTGQRANAGFFANNTFIDGGPNSNGTAVNFAYLPFKFENNIVEGFTNNLAFNNSASGNTIDYNDYYNWNTNNGWPAGSTLAGWQSGSTGYCSGGCDQHGHSNNPNLNSSYVPNSGSPVIGAGANLTSLGYSFLDVSAPQTFGVNYDCGTGCVARPASGAWDAGAYELGTAQTGPPTGVQVNTPLIVR